MADETAVMDYSEIISHSDANNDSLTQLTPRTSQENIARTWNTPAELWFHEKVERAFLFSKPAKG